MHKHNTACILSCWWLLNFRIPGNNQVGAPVRFGENLTFALMNAGGSKMPARPNGPGIAFCEKLTPLVVVSMPFPSPYFKLD
jgi:hypothetical protein